MVNTTLPRVKQSETTERDKSEIGGVWNAVTFPSKQCSTSQYKVKRVETVVSELSADCDRVLGRCHVVLL